MSGLLILILIFVGIPLLWRWLKPYFFRWAQHRSEDCFRRWMGMPPRDRKSTSRKRKSDSNGGAYYSGGYSSDPYGGQRRSRGYHSSGPLIPKEYAVDVEYTELRSYSSDTPIDPEGTRVKYKVESQVSDAEIIEIRKDR